MIGLLPTERNRAESLERSKQGYPRQLIEMADHELPPLYPGGESTVSLVPRECSTPGFTTGLLPSLLPIPGPTPSRSITVTAAENVGWTEG